MCGIACTNKPGVATDDSHLLQRRGPDQTNTIQVDDFSMTHYLLSMTGEEVSQPIVDGDIAVLFNGEVYNYKDFGDFSSDVFAIIESYKQHGENFVQHLDGEFAIVLLDKAQDLLFISADTFGIKPLYYAINDGVVGISTYKSYLDSWQIAPATRVRPNTTLKFRASTMEQLDEMLVHSFNLEQTVDSYSEWSEAFERAIAKRFLSSVHPIILPLSSGMDSGAIACALDKTDAKFYTYSFLSQEDTRTIMKRTEVSRALANKTRGPLNANEKHFVHRHYLENTEPFFYGADFEHLIHDGFKDPGGMGLTHLLSDTKSIHPEVRILASGQGGDEITTTRQTYKFGKPNPLVFADDLSSQFPWENFFYGANSSYLAKEESITGSFGIEGRYPFLDKEVVQAFLSLTPNMKNKQDKSCVWNYLEENDYHRQTVKHGFNPA